MFAICSNLKAGRRGVKGGSRCKTLPIAISDIHARHDIAKCDIQSVKTILYSNDALNALRKHRSDARAIMAKIERYAATGAGDVTDLVGRSGRRLRGGNFRVLFE